MSIEISDSFFINWTKWIQAILDNKNAEVLMPLVEFHEISFS